MDDVNLKNEKMDLLHEDDLVSILEKLGIKDYFLKGEIKCFFCSIKLTPENLGSLFEQNSEIRMICNKEVCQENLFNQDVH